MEESANIPALKAALRQNLRAQVAAISPAVRAVESLALCERLAPQLRSARRILFFAPLPDEPDVWPLLEQCLASGQTCALPGFDATTQTYAARRVTDLATGMVAGKFGIREPAPASAEIPLEDFHVILVPGVAFDWRGHRLGRGRGFYDRLLAGAGGIKCGVGYDCQLLPEIPADGRDVKVDFVFTPDRGIRRREG